MCADFVKSALTLKIIDSHYTCGNLERRRANSVSTTGALGLRTCGAVLGYAKNCSPKYGAILSCNMATVRLQLGRTFAGNSVFCRYSCANYMK